MDKIKTLQECRDQIAKELGCKTWGELETCQKAFFSVHWLRDQYDKAAEMYAEQFKPKWIPILSEDDLPNEDGNYIFVNHHGTSELKYFSASTQRYFIFQIQHILGCFRCTCTTTERRE